MTYSSGLETALAGGEASTRQLAGIWQEILGVDSITADQNYFDLGGDSALAVQMFARIEEVFGIKLPLATLYEAPTIDELARILRGEVESAGWSPLVPIQSSGTRPAFFCFHGAGGNVLNYQKLSRYLGADQPFYGLQAQGMDGASQPLASIEEMAALYVKHIRTVQPHGPYFLGGYCGGGTIAYEAAQQLHAMGEPVALLALLDTMNWYKVPLTFWSKSSHTIQQVVFHASSFLDVDAGGKLEFLKEKLDVLRSRIPVWRGMLAAKFARKDGKEPASQSEILGRVWENNDRACWAYIPKPFAGTIVDIRPAKQYRVFSKPDLKWSGLVQGQRIMVLPLNPASMLVEPFVKHLAAALRASIDDAIGAACGEPLQARLSEKN